MNSIQCQEGHVMRDHHGAYYRVHVHIGHTQRVQFEQCDLNSAVLVEHMSVPVRDEMRRMGFHLVPVRRRIEITTVITEVKPVALPHIQV